VFLIALALAAVAGPARAGETVLIHLTDDFKKNDGPVCVAFNVAWQALEDGDTVEIFFDQDAAYGLKQWEPGKTDLGLYPLPDRIKELLAETFGVGVDTLPENYQVYLERLHERGVRITVNGFWNALTQVEKTVTGKENILPIVEPITLKQFLADRAAADVYLRF